MAITGLASINPSFAIGDGDWAIVARYGNGQRVHEVRILLSPVNDHEKPLYTCNGQTLYGTSYHLEKMWEWGGEGYWVATEQKIGDKYYARCLAN